MPAYADLYLFLRGRPFVMEQSDGRGACPRALMEMAVPVVVVRAVVWVF